MHLMIEIPEEFEKDFNKDKFEDCFERLLGDIEHKEICLTGNYEIETLKMFIEAFKDADIVDKELIKSVKRENARKMIRQGIVKKLKGTTIYWGLTETNGRSYIRIGDKTFECDDSFDKNKVREMTRQVNKYIDEILKKGK